METHLELTGAALLTVVPGRTDAGARLVRQAFTVPIPEAPLCQTNHSVYVPYQPSIPSALSRGLSECGLPAGGAGPLQGRYTAGWAVVAFGAGAGAFSERGVWVLEKPDGIAEEPRGTQVTHALLAVAALLTHLQHTA